MKKKLLTPPSEHGKIRFLPNPESFIAKLAEEAKLGVCHQPYFFNPGISLKFLFLELLPKAHKEMIFLDTDRVRIDVRIPSSERMTDRIELINSDLVLYDFIGFKEDLFNQFFNKIDKILNKTDYKSFNDISSPFLLFKDIFLKKSKKKFLKEILGESFLEFYQIKGNYYFLSDLLKRKVYSEFFQKIYKDDRVFRDIFNEAIDEFRSVYRFRFKNYPFPKLEDDELPFWIIQEGKRVKCFKKDMAHTDLKKITIFPRAVTLTIFLRLYRLDAFIHGIGGGNYEWVQDRIIERFFHETPPRYAVISGTFLLGNSKERDLPYFLFQPEMIRKSLTTFLGHIDCIRNS